MRIYAVSVAICFGTNIRLDETMWKIVVSNSLLLLKEEIYINYSKNKVIIFNHGKLTSVLNSSIFILRLNKTNFIPILRRSFERSIETAS